MVRAFVPGTFDGARILEAAYQADNSAQLSGLLLGVKDVICVDQYATRCGSDLPYQLFSQKQASSVTRLLGAGAIMAGKTVTAEFAISDPGPTCNPRNLSFTPGGSSSGSAAAVAAGFCDIALGTQTSGSVIRPAGYCGVIGFKPSFGRVALDGVVPYSKSMDHIGLFAKDMHTLALTVPCLIPDWKRSACVAIDTLAVGLPIGSYLNLAKVQIIRHFSNNLQFLRLNGCRLKPVELCKDIEIHNTSHDLIANAELYQVHKQWLKNYWHLYKPLSREMLKIGRSVSPEKLSLKLEEAKATQIQIRQLMDDKSIDLWLAPVAPDLAPEGLASTGDYRMNTFWSYTGLPVITLPTGTDSRNLPYSVQIIGKFGQDESLFEASKQINKLIGASRILNSWNL